MDRLRNLMLSEDLEEITSHLRTIIDKGKMGELYDEILMEAVNSRNQRILKLHRKRFHFHDKEIENANKVFC